MHDQPSVAELIQAVKNFIDETAAPKLTGHAGFHARIASNVLATVLRDIAQRETQEELEKDGIQSLVQAPQEASLNDLNQLLCEQIKTGHVTLQTSGLLDHLKRTTIAQLSVDQPNYSGLKPHLPEQD